MKKAEQSDSFVKLEPQTVRRVMCPIHGDIGVWEGDTFMNSALTLTFNLREQTIFCLECLKELLLQEIKPCELKKPAKAEGNDHTMPGM